MKRTFILFVLLSIVTAPAIAQWNYLLGGLGTANTTLAFAVHNDTLFASGNSVGSYVDRYISPQNWVGADNGIDFTQGSITSFASLGPYFFAGNGRPGFNWRTTNNGGIWMQAAAGNICVSNRYVLSAVDGIYRSPDSGAYNPWVKMSSFNAENLASNGICVFASNSNAVWRSEDTGGTWSQISTGPLSTINSFAFWGRLTFGANGGVLKSVDSGKDWTVVSIPGRSVLILVSDSTFLFAGTDSGVYVSLDSGMNWRAVSEGLPGKNYSPHITALTVFDTLLVAGVDVGLGYGYASARPIREMVDTNLSGVQAVSIPPVDSVVIYPNPSMGMVSIRSGNISIAGVRVCNVLGQDVLDVPRAYSSDVTLDLSQLLGGTYFVQIQTATGTTLKKIVLDK